MASVQNAITKKQSPAEAGLGGERAVRSGHVHRNEGQQEDHGRTHRRDHDGNQMHHGLGGIGGRGGLDVGGVGGDGVVMGHGFGLLWGLVP